MEQGVKKVSVGDVLVNEQQPRIYFDEEKKGVYSKIST